MTVSELTVNSLKVLVDASSATPAFKQAVRDLEAGALQLGIRFNPGSPPVKVLRLVMKLLETYPQVPFESLDVEAQSGCSDFTGQAVTQPGSTRFEFEWNCLWRAEQLGWVDAFGDPDQIRAAQTFNYQCFKRLEKV